MYIYSPNGIKDILSKYGYFLSAKRGQNYLVNESIAQKIVSLIKDTVYNQSNYKVLEVGSGLGAITIPLSMNFEKVLSIEVDKGISKCLEDVLNYYKIHNVKVINKDFLKIPLDDIRDFASKDTIFVSNLPYSIGGEILRKVIYDFEIEHLFVMVQREFFDRIKAKKGSKNYSFLSVIMQLNTQKMVKLVDVSRNNFFPVPSVDSTFIYLQKSNKILDKQSSVMIQRLFSTRRKSILNSVGNLLGGNKKKAEEIIRRLGIKGNERLENFDPWSIKELISNIIVEYYQI
ncbi:MAG: 16S rRNA (adenine(1518)-N(6)/adenine(1519)-N(6))-dimethyltransferase RsmA [Brevinematia bacterium]